MKKYLLSCMIVFMGFTQSSTQEDTYHQWLRSQLSDEYGIDGGNWIFADNESQFQEMSYRLGEVELEVQGDDNTPFEKVFRCSTSAPAEQSWMNSFSILFTGTAKKGDALLFTAWVRGIEGDRGSGFVQFNISESTPPFTSSLFQPFVAKDEWVQLFLAFEAITDLNPGNLNIQLGDIGQTVELGGIALINFEDKYSMDDLPSTDLFTSYGGRGSHAEWRKDAQERIEQFRKGDMLIKVEDAQGNPLPNVEVSVKMKKHGFEFGSAITIERIIGTTPADENYRNMLTNLSQKGMGLNMATGGNGFKWIEWETGELPWFKATKSEMDEALTWLEENGFSLDAHNLIWPGWRNLPEDLEQNQEDPAYLRQRAEEHIKDILSHEIIENRFKRWHVINETSYLHDLANILGKEVYADWFKLARQYAPDAKLYLNETLMLIDGGFNIYLQNLVQEHIRIIESNGGIIDGIGLQGHFAKQLTDIPVIYDLLNDFSADGKELGITEFDINISDQQLAADYLRDFLTITFSHPSVTQFVMWEIWESSHWLGNAPLVNSDFTLKPAGEAFIDLVFNEWWTDTTLTTDGNGLVDLRGFVGDYELSLNDGEVVHVSIPDTSGVDVTMHTQSTTHTRFMPSIYEYRLSPNPMRNSCSINLSIDKPMSIQISLFDQVGKKINDLVPKSEFTGELTFNYVEDSRFMSLSPGIYWVKIDIGEESWMDKLVKL